MRTKSVRNISETNMVYLDAFAASFGEKKTSWAQYEVTVKKFLESLGDKDLVKIDWSDVEKFLADNASENESTNRNKRVHINCFLKYVINKNLGNARFNMKKNVLLGLLS